MAAQPRRSQTRLAMAIVIAGLIIGAAVYLSMSNLVKSSSCDSSSTLRCVVFQQIGACSPEFWGIPWSVTIGSATEVQPPGTKLPLDNYGLMGTLNKNYTVIVFSLPNGLYDFSVSPSAGFFTPTTGLVRVNGTDNLIQIAYTGTSCVTTSTRNDSTMTVNGSAYYSDNITDDIAVGNPGFSYFLNGSVTFMGVKFETICPAVYAGCPVSSMTAGVTQEILYAGAIRLNIAFPDSTNETLNGVIGDATYFFVLSDHESPQAGILISHTSSGYKSYLLVS